MIEDFLDNVFGEYANKTSESEFRSSLSQYGWKYFDFANLNQLFLLMHKRFGTQEVVDIDLPHFPEEVVAAHQYFDYGPDSTRVEPASHRTNPKDLDQSHQDDILVIEDPNVAAAYATPSLPPNNFDEESRDSRVNLAHPGNQYFQVRKTEESQDSSLKP